MVVTSGLLCAGPLQLTLRSLLCYLTCVWVRNGGEGATAGSSANMLNSDLPGLLFPQMAQMASQSLLPHSQDGPGSLPAH